MKTLVIYCNPNPNSYCAALRDAAVRGLVAAGHEVNVVDLYAENFTPVISPAEHRAYIDKSPIIDDTVARYAAYLRESEVLVFVYPTWWATLPAMLKGWIERVFVPGIGFGFDSRGKTEPGLRHIKRIVGVSTYGSPRLYVRAINDGGRRAIRRSLRAATGARIRTNWFPFYGIDGASHDDRAAFLVNLERRMTRL